MRVILALIASIAISATMLTTFAEEANAGYRSRRNAAIGVFAGAAALAIIAGSRSARARDYDDDGYRGHRHYRNSGGNYCGRLLRKCNDGSDWACRKYETGGCTE